MKSLPRVLIVDESADSREVLRTLLERHGATTLATPRPTHALHLAESFRPNLIVLDSDSDRSAERAVSNEIREAANRAGTPIVILGKVSRDCRSELVGQFVAKPYHYGQLIRKIESLLAAA